jgi:hypothetical protein
VPKLIKQPYKDPFDFSNQTNQLLTLPSNLGTQTNHSAIVSQVAAATVQYAQTLSLYNLTFSSLNFIE